VNVDSVYPTSEVRILLLFGVSSRTWTDDKGKTACDERRLITSGKRKGKIQISSENILLEIWVRYMSSCLGILKGSDHGKTITVLDIIRSPAGVWRQRLALSIGPT
jgi:hypothetical protein